MIDYPEGYEEMMEEDKTIWEKHIGVPAIFIEQLECQARTRTISDTEIVYCNNGAGSWGICRNPSCYRCDIIDKAEMWAHIPLDKEETNHFIGRLRTECTSWKETTVQHNIIISVHFLKNNRREKMKLARLGAIILTMEEAKEVITEELSIDHHFIDSPQTKSDRNSRINVEIDFDQDFPNERATFKSFKRCDIRDTASHLRSMKYMEGAESNEYTVEGLPGSFK
eukprot:16438956-Heterocapsa_arctica.AAC.1